jgi:hypothetical protein
MEGNYIFTKGDHSTQIELYCEIIDDMLVTWLSKQELENVMIEKCKHQRVLYTSFESKSALIDVCESFISDLLAYQNCDLRVKEGFWYIIHHIINR